MIKTKKIYYIEPVVIPGKAAHSIQIQENIKELNKISKLTLISYYFDKKIGICKHIAFKKSRFFNKIVPWRIFHFLFLIRKIKFDKNSYLITRNPILAIFLNKKFNNIAMEIHSIPNIKNNLIQYTLFYLFLFNIPLFFLKRKNIKFIVINNILKKDLIKKGFNANKIKVLPDAVDLKKFDINLSKKEARKKLKFPINKKIILYTGTFQDWKGYDILLEASNNFDEKVVFVMIGGKKKQITRLRRIYKKVILKEFMNNKIIPYYLKAADILIIPNSAKKIISLKYTSPLKLFEYMASKRPIIASDLPSIREIVSEKEVLFFEPDNPEDLAEKIRILLKDIKLQEDISKNAFEKVKNFTWEKRARNIINKILN